MDIDDINDKFLVTGYKKRLVEGSTSPRWQRPFIGRKGIGKLSVFSIARDVQVYSTRIESDSHGLEINIKELEEEEPARKCGERGG